MKTQTEKFRRSHHRAGFTLVELLVATTVTLILLTVCGMAMQSTSQAVEVTIANQDVSGYAASLANTLRDDFRRLRSDTFMVIKNQSVKPFAAAGAEQFTNDRYNIDQIMFFANGPWTSQRYSTGGLQRTLQADFARVWYGHLAADNTTGALGTAYQPQYAANGGLLPQIEWMLGRHVLLLPNSPNTGALAGFPSDIWDHAKIATGKWDAVGNISAIGAEPPVFRANSFNDILSQAAYPALTAGEAAAVGFDTAGKVTWPSSPGWIGGVAIANQYEAVSDACFRVRGSRFLANSIDLAAMLDATQLTSNVCVPFCSDFKVEFAGDFTDSSNTGTPDGIIDLENDVTPGKGDQPTSIVTSANPIYWYGGINNGDQTVKDPADYNVVVAKQNGRRYVQPVAVYGGNGTVSATNPVNVFTYPDATTTGGPENTGSINQPYTAIFGPDHTVTPWPKLIRITVVLHDEHGRFHQRYVKSKPAPGSDSFLAAVPDGKTYQFILEVP